jgi:hypothetical protein
MSGRWIVALTNSQKMALIDVLCEQMRSTSATEVFIDCSEHPAIETTIGDLLRLVTEAEFKPDEEKRRA